MATAILDRPAPEPQSATIHLHPAIARQAALSAWTDDAAVAYIFHALADLSAIGERLQMLGGARPELGLRSAVGDVGTMTSRHVQSGMLHQWSWEWQPNGGACVTLWDTLKARRAAWIDATLQSEGLSSDSDDGFRRWSELSNEAISVDAAFEAWRAA